MIHQGQGLALGLKAGDHLLGVHPQLDDLQCHFPADRLLLLRHVHHSAPSMSNLLKQPISPNPVTRFLDHHASGAWLLTWHFRLSTLRSAATEDGWTLDLRQTQAQETLSAKPTRAFG